MNLSRTHYVLIDAHALIHRAYHAIPKFTGPDNEPTGALYGVAVTLTNIIELLSPTHITGAFDRPEPTIRSERFPAYKAHRKAAEPDLVKQLIESRALFRALSIPVVERAGSEADDIIGTLAEQQSAWDIDTVSIVTGDLDALQLVRGDVVTAHIFQRGGGTFTVFDESAVFERYGLSPKTLIDYKALVGDASDNIPGVPNIGPKTATKLLLAHQSVDGIYQSIEKVAEPLRGTLLSHKEQVYLARDLATIDRFLPLNISAEACIYKKPDYDVCRAYYEKCGFSSLIKRLARTRETPLL